MKIVLLQLFFLFSLAGVLAKNSLPLGVHSLDEPLHEKNTFVYKTTESGLALEADVFSPPSGHNLPVIISIHGGGLLNGTKETIPFPWKKLVKMGFVVVSINYRLAPETKLDAMLQDVEDALLWVKEKGPKLFHIDPNRIGVIGGSAGAFLALQTANNNSSSIKALVSLWGYADLGVWANSPSEVHLEEPLIDSLGALKNYTSDEKGFRDKPVKGDFNAGRFYLYCRQQGLWGNAVTGIKPDQPAKYDKYNLSKNLSEHFPPVIFVHGEQDNDVPFKRIEAMSKQITHSKLISSKSAGHGFQGATRQEMIDMHEEVLRFLMERLN